MSNSAAIVTPSPSSDSPPEARHRGSLAAAFAAAAIALLLAAILADGARAAAPTDPDRASAPKPSVALSVNGLVSAQGYHGDPLTISISGPAGRNAYLLADFTAGPTTLFGRSLPLGFGPSMNAFPLGPLPATGTLSVSTVFPSVPGVSEIEVHLLVLVLDPAALFGLDFSNGASLLLIEPPTAGANQGSIVGSTVTLDGRSVADGFGELIPDRTVVWFFTRVPSGSLATIQDPMRPFASFVPDVPGDYQVTASVTVRGLPIAPRTTVHVWSIQTSPPAGSVVSGPVSVTGTLLGPAVPGLLVDNVPTLVNPVSGAFGPVNVSFAPGEVVAYQELRVIHPDASVAVQRQTWFDGIGASPGLAAPDPLSYALRQPGIDVLSGYVDGYIEGEEATIANSVTGISESKLARETGAFGNVVFAAYAKLQSLSYGNVTSSINARANQWDATVQLHNLRVTARITGSVLGVSYNKIATITANPAEITTGLQVAVTGSSVLVDAVPPQSVQLQNFNFSMPGFIGSAAQLRVIQNALRANLESILEDQISKKTATGYEQVFRGLLVEADVLGIHVSARFSGAFSGNAHSVGGLTLRLQSTATPNSQPPGAPTILEYRSTPSTNPVFGALTPASVSYSSATAVSDDCFNQILAAATMAGLLESTVPHSGSGGSLGLTAGTLATSVPFAGFDSFDPAAPITLRTHATVAPTIQPTPAGPGHADLHCPEVEVSFDLDTSYGAVTILRIALDDTRSLALEVAEDATLDVTLLAESAALSVVSTLPGEFVAFLPGGLLSGSTLLPQPMTLLGGVPVPSMRTSQLVEVPQETALVGPSLDHVATFGVLVPR